MKSFILLITTLLVLSGCASTGAQQAKVDRITPEELAKLLPPAVATLTLDEIVTDSKAGKTPDEIIAKIKTSNSRYDLTTSQTLDLSKQGVDVKVLDYMRQNNELAKQNAIADEMNKREREKRAAQKQLQRERAFNNNLYYDPFWGSHFGGFYGPIGPGYRYWPRSRFGFGLSYGHPFYR